MGWGNALEFPQSVFKALSDLACNKIRYFNYLGPRFTFPLNFQEVGIVFGGINPEPILLGPIFAACPPILGNKISQRQKKSRRVPCRVATAPYCLHTTPIGISGYAMWIEGNRCPASSAIPRFWDYLTS